MRAPAVWQGLATNVSLLRVRRAGPGGTVYRVLSGVNAAGYSTRLIPPTGRRKQAKTE